MAASRAAVVTAYNEPLEILEVPIPKLADGAMLTRIEVSTLCATDVHRWDGMHKVEGLPYITGHEPCGFVEELSSLRTDILGNPLQKGDRVVWSYVSCGHCYWCVIAQQPCVCPGRASWGHQPLREFPALLGSVSEYMYVPPECQVIKVPEEVSSATAAAASCAYRTIMHGYDRLGAIKSHESVLILGAGPLGIYAAAVAREQGAKKVLLIGAPEGRLEIARKMGTDDVLNLDEVTDVNDRVAWVKDHCGGRGIDIVIQAANNYAIPDGLKMMRPGGRFVNIGAGGKIELSPTDFPMESTFFTVMSGEPRHWQQAIDFLASRADRYPFDDMITASYRLEQVNEAMAAMASLSVVKGAIYL